MVDVLCVCNINSRFCVLANKKAAPRGDLTRYMYRSVLNAVCQLIIGRGN